VLFVLSPALARLLGVGLIVAHAGNMDGISLVKLAMPSMAVMMALIVFYYYKFGNFKHPSFWLLMVCHLPYLFVVQVGDNVSVRQVLAAVFT
jgi:hypothetical protein